MTICLHRKRHEDEVEPTLNSLWNAEEVMYEPMLLDAPTMAMLWMWLFEGMVLM